MEIVMTTITVPNVGSTVELDVIDPHAARMIPPRDSVRRYRGEVLPGYRWLTDREFCLTGDDRWPVRVMNLAYIKNIRIITGTSRQVQTQTQTFQVRGSRGDHYTVTRSLSGWHCGCKGFEFRGRCRHITEAQTQ
jgi:hypothetical protein